VLTVRDNEHDSENSVADNEVMLSEVTECFLILVGNAPELRRVETADTGWGQEPPRNPCVSRIGYYWPVILQGFV
jgi:hypothetical protein